MAKPRPSRKNRPPKVEAKDPQADAPAGQKRVRVTVEVDNQFLHLLNANIQLTRNVRGWLLGNDEAGDITASQVLGLLVYMEARGAYPEEIALKTPPMWRSNIDVIHADRRVYQNKKGHPHVLIAGPCFCPNEKRWCEKHQVVFETAECPMCAAGMKPAPDPDEWYHQRYRADGSRI